MAGEEHSPVQKANAGPRAAAPAAEGEASAPGMSEADRRQVRLLTGIVIGLGVLLLAGLGVLLASVVMRGGKPPAAEKEMTLPLPSQAVVEGITLDGAILALRVRAGQQREIIVLDTRKGRLLQRVRLKEQKRAQD